MVIVAVADWGLQEWWISSKQESLNVPFETLSIDLYQREGALEPLSKSGMRKLQGLMLL